MHELDGDRAAVEGARPLGLLAGGARELGRLDRSEATERVERSREVAPAAEGVEGPGGGRERLGHGRGSISPGAIRLAGKATGAPVYNAGSMRCTPPIRPLVLLLAFALAAAPGAAGSLHVLPDALRPAGTGGLAAVDRALAALATDRRLLVVGAHPDDEDSTALTLVDQGMGGEAAYLALSRGEGGQNLIGEELGEALGVLRTNELLAARGVDGGRQFFSRAYDFGYTRSLDETLARWPRELLLEDAVRVVRRFRPQVILSVFGNDGSGGHGQHQAAGWVAHEAFRLAGDPAFRPDLGPAWTVTSLFRSAWFRPEAATAIQPMGAIDPFSGHSLAQIAALSRSQHRSQDMGRALDLGGRDGRYTRVEGPAGESDDLFSGVDTRLAGVAAALGDDALRRRIEPGLERAERAARAARGGLGAGELQAAVAALGAARAEISAALDAVVGAEGAGVANVAELLQEKRRVAGLGWVAARSIAFEAETERERLVGDEPVHVAVSIWNAGSEPLGVVGVSLVGPELGERAAPDGARTLAPGELAKWEIEVELPARAQPTAPDYLHRPRHGDLYDWEILPPEERGEPFGAPPLAAHFALEAPGGELVVVREVVARSVDQALGEIRRPLRIVPPVEVSVVKPLVIVTASAPAETISVELHSNAMTPVAGVLESRGDCGGQGLEPVRFELAPGERARFERSLRACPGAAGGRTATCFVARLDDGRESDLALPVIDYPHIRPTPMPVAATVEVVPVDLVWPAIGEVGYVLGASDRVPAALAEAGLAVTLLSGRDLADGDVARFGAIVVGSRAYETEPALAEANARLLDYARGGGLVIVQYQQYDFVRGGFAPFPLEIARPHDRVTDESSPVVALVPGHAVFAAPNAIGPDDWRGWVQERSLYMPATWDAAYQPLLELRDPEQPAQRGALLVAPLGRGHYVYTGLAFFRQLPAGVPGAFRLFANLLGLAGPRETP